MTKEVAAAVHIITEGRVVAFPTGTSYGLAVDALQGHALQRLRNLKGRSREKTFTIFLQPKLWDVYLNLTEKERQLLEMHANKPLTLLVKPKKNLEYLSQDGRIGLRVIDHPSMEQLAQAVEVPLTATSANISGEPACHDVTCIYKYFPGILDPADTRHGDIKRAGRTTYDLSLGAVLDGGKLAQQQPTTIAKVVDSVVEIIRQGELKSIG